MRRKGKDSTGKRGDQQTILFLTYLFAFDCDFGPEQGHRTTPAAIVGIVVVANTTVAPNTDPSVRPAGAPSPGPTTSAPTTPASP